MILLNIFVFYLCRLVRRPFLPFILHLHLGAVNQFHIASKKLSIVPNIYLCRLVRRPFLPFILHLHLGAVNQFHIASKKLSIVPNILYTNLSNTSNSTFSKIY